VCEAFNDIGYCVKGDECTEKHIWECKEFSERGTCGKKGCKGPHMLRRRNVEIEQNDEEEEEDDENGIRYEVDTVGSSSRYDASAKTKKRKTESQEGISGAAGRQLKKSKATFSAGDEDGFLSLSIPLSDNEDEELDGEEGYEEFDDGEEEAEGDGEDSEVDTSSDEDGRTPSLSTTGEVLANDNDDEDDDDDFLVATLLR
jgi:hypothetical protein